MTSTSDVPSGLETGARIGKRCRRSSAAFGINRVEAREFAGAGEPSDDVRLLARDLERVIPFRCVFQCSPPTSFVRPHGVESAPPRGLALMGDWGQNNFYDIMQVSEGSRKVRSKCAVFWRKSRGFQTS